MKEPSRRRAYRVGRGRLLAVVRLGLCVFLGWPGQVRTGSAREAIDAGSTDLVARARVELARPGRSPDDLAQVAGWLEQAAVAMPSSFEARLLLGQVMLMRRRALDAIPIFEQACALARGAAEVFPCSLALAEARAQTGRYDQALREYRRHLEVGNPAVVPWVRVRSGELCMALGDAGAAEVEFGHAIARLSETPRDSEQRGLLVRAMLGQAVAHDRAGHENEARQTLWRALALDPALSTFDRETVEVHPFLPEGERLYYRGLASRVLGEPGKALAAFEAYLDTSPRLWRQRAESHMLALAADGADVPTPMPRQGRVVAVATLRSEGPIPAPMIDAAWRDRRRMLDACLGDLPDDAPRVLRLALRLDIPGSGMVRSATVELDAQAGFGLSDAWRRVIACVEKRVEGGLRLPKPSNMRRTSAWVELVLAISR